MTSPGRAGASGVAGGSPGAAPRRASRSAPPPRRGRGPGVPAMPHPHRTQRPSVSSSWIPCPSVITGEAMAATTATSSRVLVDRWRRNSSGTPQSAYSISIWKPVNTWIAAPIAASTARRRRYNGTRRWPLASARRIRMAKPTPNRNANVAHAFCSTPSQTTQPMYFSPMKLSTSLERRNLWWKCTRIIPNSAKPLRMSSVSMRRPASAAACASGARTTSWRMVAVDDRSGDARSLPSPGGGLRHSPRSWAPVPNSPPPGLPSCRWNS